MKQLYFDAFAGASGDMILGALVAAGVEPHKLINELRLLGVGDYEVEFEFVMRSGIAATRAVVRTEAQTHHRNLTDILDIINRSPLKAAVKERASKIFTRLAAAEARVHNEPIERVHFHEVGATDAIIDIVGACICFEMLGVDNFRCSALHTGTGSVEMAHGRFPVPPPAVIELLQDAPIYSTDIKGELLTPTGAAIISTVCAGNYGGMPQMKIKAAGYGAGTRDYTRFPNVLRVVVGELIESGIAEREIVGAGDEMERASDVDVERLTMLETNLDDLSGQITGHLMTCLLAAGALDCFFTSVQMKKNRPGVLVSVLCREPEARKMRDLLFRETTTLGVRAYSVERHALAREVRSVETLYGRIDVKVAYLNGERRSSMPEFEQCRAIAERANVPVQEVIEAARSLAWRTRKHPSLVEDEESTEQES